MKGCEISPEIMFHRFAQVITLGPYRRDLRRMNDYSEMRLLGVDDPG